MIDEYTDDPHGPYWTDLATVLWKHGYLLVEGGQNVFSKEDGTRGVSIQLRCDVREVDHEH